MRYYIARDTMAVHYKWIVTAADGLGGCVTPRSLYFLTREAATEARSRLRAGGTLQQAETAGRLCNAERQALSGF